MSFEQPTIEHAVQAFRQQNRETLGEIAYTRMLPVIDQMCEDMIVSGRERATLFDIMAMAVPGAAAQAFSDEALDRIMAEVMMAPHEYFDGRVYVLLTPQKRQFVGRSPEEARRTYRRFVCGEFVPMVARAVDRG